MVCLSLPIIFILIVYTSTNTAFRKSTLYIQNLLENVYKRRSYSLLFGTSYADSNVAVMINGLPGAMAAETANVCLERGLTIVPYGFTGKSPLNKHFMLGTSTTIELIEGPGINENANSILSRIKSEFPNLIIVDYTHPSAVLPNIAAYTANHCDFVMGTTGVDISEMKNEFNKGSGYAVIAPNMAKQIVALQYALEQVSKRFPNAYGGYNLKVI